VGTHSGCAVCGLNPATGVGWWMVIQQPVWKIFESTAPLRSTLPTMTPVWEYLSVQLSGFGTYDLRCLGANWPQMMQSYLFGVSSFTRPSGEASELLNIC